MRDQSIQLREMKPQEREQEYQKQIQALRQQIADLRKTQFEQESLVHQLRIQNESQKAQYQVTEI